MNPAPGFLSVAKKTSHVYFVIEGTIRVLNYSSSGRVVRFASVGPGGLPGELSAMDGLPRSATVVADQPSFLAKYPGGKFPQFGDHRARIRGGADSQDGGSDQGL